MSTAKLSITGTSVIDQDVSTTATPTFAGVKSVGASSVTKPLVASVASGATITAAQLLGGAISGTGATGNWVMPATSTITTALGTSPVGTYFDFSFIANGMTAANVATLTVGANMVILKQVSSGDSADNQLMTITNTSNVNVGHFRIFFDTATSTVLSRLG